MLVLPGVLDDLPRRLLHDIGERVLVVIESLIDPPPATRQPHALGVVSGLYLLAELFRSTTATHERVSRRTVLEGTARYQGGFSDV